jgi:hypothetical protein
VTVRGALSRPMVASTARTVPMRSSGRERADLRDAGRTNLNTNPREVLAQ